MRRRRKLAYVILPLVIAILTLCLPKSCSQSLSEKSNSSFASFWNTTFSMASPEKRRYFDIAENIQNSLFLRDRVLENFLLLQENKRLKSIFFQKGTSNTEYLVGKVIYRSPNAWNSFLWIDIGREDNPFSDDLILEKNSPVLANGSLVGLIEYVGKKTSLVRLITDENMCPSVRIRRSDAKTWKNALYKIQKALALGDISFEKEEELKAFLYLLKQLEKNESHDASKRKLLAKGELRGSGATLFRSPKALLRGVGFNYDFEDSYGPKRDLRTGSIVDGTLEEQQNSALALLQVGDTLVTSGLDGVFPEGIKVATIVDIDPLKEGAIAYEFDAEPTCKNLFDLDYVSVLKPCRLEKKTISNVDKILDLIQENAIMR